MLDGEQLKVENLGEPVKFSLKDGCDSFVTASVVTYENDDPSLPYKTITETIEEVRLCVFWDEAEERWSDRGVRAVIGADGCVQCESYHLTSFGSAFGESIGKFGEALADEIMALIACSHAGLMTPVAFSRLATFYRRPLAVIALLGFITFALIVRYSMYLDRKRKAEGHWNEESLLTDHAVFDEKNYKVANTFMDEVYLLRKLGKNVFHPKQFSELLLEASSKYAVAGETGVLPTDLKAMAVLTHVEGGNHAAEDGNEGQGGLGMTTTKSVRHCEIEGPVYKFFHNETSIWKRWRMVYYGINPWIGITTVSVTKSSQTRCLILFSKMYGAFFMGALFFQNFVSFPGVENEGNPDC
jgi:hypothetical protein